MTEHDVVIHDVLILGAGLSGIGLGIQLLSSGRRSFVILEQADAVGGTWRDNTYPGAGCDTESHLYCYSFGLHPEVSRAYARQPEIRSYIERLVDAHALRGHIRLNTEVVAARWDDRALLWRVDLADGRTMAARCFVAAWGQLNRPQVPDLPGRERFSGASFHSARWRHDIDLAGARVASIGNAASAVQYIPEIAPRVGHLDVFQRSPNWVVPRLDRAYSAEERAAWCAQPELFRADRDALFRWRESLFERMRTGSDASRELEAIAHAHLAAQVSDPVLRARLTPDYPSGCKRILRSDDYFPALMRDNVTLVTEPVEHVAANGIVTTDGVLHEADVIIYGTGFETHSFQGPVEITGRCGRSLRETWRDGARAYLGICVAGQPNFFMLYGPNTNLGHNSILMMLEAQCGYILQALELLDRNPHRALDLRQDAFDRFDRALQSEMGSQAWAGNCTSWYKNQEGRVINNWSGTVQEYQARTARLDAGDYELLDGAAADV